MQKCFENCTVLSGHATPSALYDRLVEMWEMGTSPIKTRETFDQWKRHHECAPSALCLREKPLVIPSPFNERQHFERSN